MDGRNVHQRHQGAAEGKGRMKIVLPAVPESSEGRVRWGLEVVAESPLCSQVSLRPSSLEQTGQLCLGCIRYGDSTSSNTQTFKVTLLYAAVLPNDSHIGIQNNRLHWTRPIYSSLWHLFQKDNSIVTSLGTILGGTNNKSLRIRLTGFKSWIVPSSVTLTSLFNFSGNQFSLL